MGKGLKIFLKILGVSLVIFGAGFLWVYLSFYSTGPLAVLSIEEGTAQYASIAGEWKDAKSGMELKQGYFVKTLAASKAKILFSDSVMRLDANTEITIDNLSPESVSLIQSVGKTWSRLLKISGISNYEVTTPNAVATVRGTGFSVEVKDDGTEVKVAEGEVEFDSFKEKASVSENKQITVKKDDTGLEGKEEVLTKDAWTNDNLAKDKEHNEEIKAYYAKKYGGLMRKAQSQFGLSDEEANKLLNEWIEGKHSIQVAIDNGIIPPGLAKLIPAELKRY